MTYSIAFCGVDGAGKTTLIDKATRELELPVNHINEFMKNFYTHQQSEIWEWLNLAEIIIRNIIWKFKLNKRSMLMDRCYICSLTFSTSSLVNLVKSEFIKDCAPLSSDL